MTEEQKYLLQQLLYEIRDDIRKLLRSNDILSSVEKNAMNDRLIEALNNFLESL